MKILNYNEFANVGKKIIKESNETPTFEDLVFGRVTDEGKFEITLDGWFALWKTIYSVDLTPLTEYIEFVKEVSFKQVDYDSLYLFVFNKVTEDATTEEILEAIKSGDFLNYLGEDKMFVYFENNEYEDWVNRVAEILGVVLK